MNPNRNVGFKFFFSNDFQTLTGLRNINPNKNAGFIFFFFNYFKINSMKKFLLIGFSFCTLIFVNQVDAQKKKLAAPVATNNLEQDPIIKAQNFRLVGPFRGGRAAAGVGSYTDVNTFYMGATGGGVWKTIHCY